MRKLTHRVASCLDSEDSESSEGGLQVLLVYQSTEFRDLIILGAKLNVRVERVDGRAKKSIEEDLKSWISLPNSGGIFHFYFQSVLDQEK